MPRTLIRRALPLAALLAAFVVVPTGRAQFTPFAVQGRVYDTSQVTSRDPILEEIFSMANDVGFRVGTWGGASRDFLRGRGSPPEFSDVDMVYDSRELKQALTADGPIGFVKKLGRMSKAYWRIYRIGGFKAIKRYTWLDMQREKPMTMSIQKLMDTGSLTINRVGLMNDGSIYDPSGGLADALDGKLRYVAPKPVKMLIEDFDDIHNSSPADVLRAVRFKFQYPELKWAEGTLETLKKIMAYYGPDSPYTRAIVEHEKGLRGTLRKIVPGVLKRPISAVKNFMGKQSYGDLRPYIEKGFKKVLASTQDPTASLALYRELGLDVFARQIGMGKYVDELEGRAAGQPAASRTPETEEQPPEGSPRKGPEAWRRVAEQAYRNYLRAQEEGDTGAAQLQFRIYRRARDLEGRSP